MRTTGLSPGGVLEAKVVLSDTMLFRGSGREAFVTTLLERVRAMPGVQHAGFGTNLPPRPALVTMAVDFVSDGRTRAPVHEGRFRHPRLSSERWVRGLSPAGILTALTPGLEPPW